MRGSRLRNSRPTILRLLLHKHHFLQQVACAGQLIYGEQDITDVERDVAAVVGVEYDVAHRAFPYAVEIQTDQGLPSLLITGLPELPPEVWLVAMKQTGTVFLPLAVVIAH